MAVIVCALAFGARGLPLPLPLLLVFGLGLGALALAPTSTSSAMPVSSVPSRPPSSSSPSPSSAGGRARLARPLVLALAPAFAFGFGSLARMLWQLSRKQETSLSSAFDESKRNRARFASVCRTMEQILAYCLFDFPHGRVAGGDIFGLT